MVSTAGLHKVVFCVSSFYANYINCEYADAPYADITTNNTCARKTVAPTLENVGSHGVKRNKK